MDSFKLRAPESHNKVRSLDCMMAISKVSLIISVMFWEPNKTKGLWRAGRLANYLTKYLDKSFDMLEHATKRYWASKGAPKPEVTTHWLGSLLLEALMSTCPRTAAPVAPTQPRTLYQQVRR